MCPPSWSVCLCLRRVKVEMRAHQDLLDSKGPMVNQEERDLQVHQDHLALQEPKSL